MVGNGLRKSRKTVMKKITLIFSVIFLVGCSGDSENIVSQSIDKNESFNWRLVTSWPKLSRTWNGSRENCRPR